jgi:2-iminobutanoate/2-iminopropanoate deaminase
MPHPHREVVFAPKAPAAIGPYSHAVRHGPFVFASGQTGLDPSTGEIAGEGIEDQTRRVLTNLAFVLEAAGSSLAAVVKTTVFLRSMDDFARMNAVYGQFFPQDPPARTTVAVAALPRGALVEIEAVAALAEAHGD